MELPVPLLPINLDSAGNSNNNCNSEMTKSEPIQINCELSASVAELSEITKTGNQPSAKR